MENPNTWDDITKLIDKTIQDWYKSQEDEVIGLSLASTIRKALDDANLLNIK